MKEDHNLSRRTFLLAAGGTLASIGLPGVFIRLSSAEQRSLATQTRPDGRPRLPPGQIAVRNLQAMGGTPGTATAADLRLRIYGEVEKPAVLTYQDLLSLEQVDITCDVHCVTGWTLLDSQWSGVRLRTVLDKVRPRPNGAFVIFEAPAGYTTNVPVTALQSGSAILAHSFFGKQLPKEFGAPVRVVIPDLYFYKSAKWLEAIKVTPHDEPGYWEARGYSNSADPWKEERYSKSS